MSEKIIKKLKEKEKELKRKKDVKISRQRNKTVSSVRSRGDRDQNITIPNRNIKGNKSMGQFLRKSNREKNNDNRKKNDLKYLSRTPKRENKSRSFYSKTDVRTDIQRVKRVNEQKLITNLTIKKREDKSRSKGKNLFNKRDSKKDDKKIEIKNNISKRPSKFNIKEKLKIDIKNKNKGKERIEDKKDNNKNKDININKKREIKIKDIKKIEKIIEGKKEEKKEKLINENKEGTKNDEKKDDNIDGDKKNDLKNENKKEIINEEKDKIKSEDNKANMEEQKENKQNLQNLKSSNTLFNKIISNYGKIINYLNNEEKKNLLLVSKDSAKFIIEILKELNKKQLEESENALNQFKSKNKEEEYIGEIPQFQLSRTGLKILEKLNEENNQKLFTSEEIPNKDIILIYRLFLQLVNKDKDINIKNIKDEDFWKIAKDKIFINKKGQFGEHIKEMINEIDFSCENLDATSNISKNYMDKLNAKYISNLSQTTGMFFVLIKEIFEYCGIFENKKTSLAIEYRRLEYNLKKYKEKEERLNKIIDITQKNI